MCDKFQLNGVLHKKVNFKIISTFFRYFRRIRDFLFCPKRTNPAIYGSKNINSYFACCESWQVETFDFPEFQMRITLIVDEIFGKIIRINKFRLKANHCVDMCIMVQFEH
jgi:hypothetical protein